MYDMYNFIIDSIEHLSIPINKTELAEMKKVVIIGSNKDGYIQDFVHALCDKEQDIQIIVLMQENMLNKLKNIHNNEITIICHDKYSINDSIRILEEAENDKIDGFFFVGRNKDDMGNLNILEIADDIKKKNNGELNVYGTDFDGQIYLYKDISTYVKGLKLYNDLNNYIDEVVNNT